MTLCALTFSNTSFIEERIAAKLTHSMRKCLTVSGDWQAAHTGWSKRLHIFTSSLRHRHKHHSTIFNGSIPKRPIARSYSSSYSPSIVTEALSSVVYEIDMHDFLLVRHCNYSIALSYIIFELFDVE